MQVYTRTYDMFQPHESGLKYCSHFRNGQEHLIRRVARECGKGKRRMAWQVNKRPTVAGKPLC